MYVRFTLRVQIDIGGYEVVSLEKEFDHCYWFYFQQIDQVIQIELCKKTWLTFMEWRNIGNNHTIYLKHKPRIYMSEIKNW